MCKYKHAGVYIIGQTLQQFSYNSITIDSCSQLRSSIAGMCGYTYYITVLQSYFNP